jgi:DNA repair exonuclease SbcCD nuclease subunit
MTLTVVNDWHLGANRSAGTTPATAYQLRQDLLTAAEEILYSVTGDLLVNGDLFDGPDIPRADLLQAVRIFGDWLTRAPGSLFLANGNHDLDKNSTRLSSFQFFAQLLLEMHGPARVAHIAEGTSLPRHDAYVIPHVANQDLFNMELAKVPACRFLFVHANYDNQFAVEADHSLNLSKEQAEQLPVEYIVFGHEHQARTELGGKVVIVGNQFPSSISDCLGNQDKALFCTYQANRAASYALHTTWQDINDFGKVDYSEQDWRGLTDVGRFIRITGTATAAEADKVVTAIGRFRREAKALVITNAVKIEGVDDGAEMTLSHEDVTSFNVLEALREYLGPDDAAEIDKIMGEDQCTS